MQFIFQVQTSGRESRKRCDGQGGAIEDFEIVRRDTLSSSSTWINQELATTLVDKSLCTYN